MFYYKAIYFCNRNMEKHPTDAPQGIMDSICSHRTSWRCRVYVFRLTYFHCDNDVDHLTGVSGEEISAKIKSLALLSANDCITVAVVWRR